MTLDANLVSDPFVIATKLATERGSKPFVIGKSHRRHVSRSNISPWKSCRHLITDSSMSIIRLGKSEVIKNNLNPNWVKVFVLDYELGSTTKVALSIFDEVR